MAPVDTDLVFLSRLQFAVTIMFHYLFPPLTIGLGVLLVYMEWRYLRTGEKAWERATRFFVRLFAVNFVMGVATGIVMEFEFGTNWAGYSRFVGDVFGSILAAEGLWAFFLESGFLAILVFGWNRVTPAFHFFATLMVAIGSIFSAVWITVANSWMQTPAGFSVQPVLKDGVPWVVNGQVLQRAVLTDFFAALLNPSTANRISHVLVGALVMGGVFVLSISAWYLLRRRQMEIFRRTFGVGLAAAVVGVMGAMVTGDANARMVAVLQPAKLAAMEALAVTPDGPAGLTVMGVPRVAEGKDPEGLVMPGMLSALVYREIPPRTNLPGLDLVAEEDRPNAGIVFWTFRAMVMAGSALLLLVLWGTYCWYRNTAFTNRALLWCCVLSVLPGVVANQTGWVTAEVGRQPWLVSPPVPRVDPDAGAHSGLYLVKRGGAGAPAQFRVWVPGEPGAELAREGWRLAMGERIVRDGAAVTAPGADPHLRAWREGDPVEMIVYDGTTGMRTSEGISTVLHAETVATSLVLFLMIYAVLGVIYVVAMNHLIQRGPGEEADQMTAAVLGPRRQRASEAEGGIG